MPGHRSVKADFNKHSEVDFQRRFRTPEAQKAAREVNGRAGRLIEKAESRRDERVKKIIAGKQEKPQPTLKPSFAERIFGQHRAARQHAIRAEHSRFQRRADRIINARDNQLQRIEERQHQPRREATPHGNGGQSPAPDRGREAENSPPVPSPGQAVEKGFLSAQFSPAENEQAPTAPPEAAREDDSGQQPEAPPWTPDERDLAIEAERERQRQQDSERDPGTGREIE